MGGWAECERFELFPKGAEAWAEVLGKSLGAKGAKACLEPVYGDGLLPEEESSGKGLAER